MAKRPKQLQIEIDDYLAKLSAAKPAPVKHGLMSPDPARIAAYAAKQEDKRDRLNAAAGRARSEAHRRHGAAHSTLDRIPFGQPILVGHHSEKRHRRDLERAHMNTRKGFEASDRAAELAGRASSIGKGGISSDDPAAVLKLRAELAPLVKLKDTMKAANAAIRKHAKAGPPAQIAALVALGIKEPIAAKLLTKDFAGRIGFPDYALTNNGANIRRIEKRIAELLKHEETPARAPISGTLPDGMTFTIEENKDENRTQIHFSGKPSDALRAQLKADGFRWAPTLGVWQRQISIAAWHRAQRALGLEPKA